MRRSTFDNYDSVDVQQGNNRYFTVILLFIFLVIGIGVGIIGKIIFDDQVLSLGEETIKCVSPSGQEYTWRENRGNLLVMDDLTEAAGYECKIV